jgi:hypothetical protein
MPSWRPLESLPTVGIACDWDAEDPLGIVERARYSLLIKGQPPDGEVFEASLHVVVGSPGEAPIRIIRCPPPRGPAVPHVVMFAVDHHSPVEKGAPQSKRTSSAQSDEGSPASASFTLTLWKRDVASEDYSL